MAYWLPDSRVEMPELFIPGRKPTRPVQVDKTHPLAKGLCRAVLGRPVALMQSKPLVTSNWPSSYGIDGQHGQIMSGDGGVRYVDLDTTYCGPVPGFTFAVLVRANSNYREGFVGNYASGGAQNRAMFRGNSGHQFYLGNASTGAWLGPAYSPNGHTTGEWTFLIARWNGTQVQVFQDGDWGTAQSASTTFDMSSRSLKIGYEGSSQAGPDADFALVYVWDRGLSDDECMRLYRNPYQMMIPA